MRYDAAQIVEAVGRARGEGRFFLVLALTQLPDPADREDALAQVLDKKLRPDERIMALGELTSLNPQDYLGIFVDVGLRSRSISVQQVTIGELPLLMHGGLSAELTAQVIRWLRHRLANPRRSNTWAGWEVPAAALALLPSIGLDSLVALLDELEPRLQPEERQRWHELRRRTGEHGFLGELEAWWQEDGPGAEPPADPTDPTADVYVDRVMKRLGHEPANPDSAVYDSLADFDVPMYVIDLETGRNDLRTERREDQ